MALEWRRVIIGKNHGNITAKAGKKRKKTVILEEFGAKKGIENK